MIWSLPLRKFFAEEMPVKEMSVEEVLIEENSLEKFPLDAMLCIRAGIGLRGGLQP